jgi:hypothetical protein
VRCREVEARAPFIGREGERGGREAGVQAVIGGASSKRQLWKRRQGGGHLMRGEMKGVGRWFSSAPKCTQT